MSATPVKQPSPVRSALAAGAALLAAACAPLDAPMLEGGSSQGRPSDGLLDSPALQRVVVLQEARDGVALQAFLADPDAAVRARAAFALASVQDSSATAALAGLLSDPDPRVRGDAAFALGQLPAGGTDPGLTGALASEEDPAVRALLVEALGKRCDERSADVLLELDDTEQLPGATLALARCALAGVRETDAWARLARDLTHADPEVRFWAAYPFGRVNEPFRWRPHLATVRNALLSYGADEAAAMHLVRAVGRLRDRALWRDLTWWLRNATDWRVRVNAAEALGRYEILGPQSYLVGALRDASSHVRLQAVQGLGQSPPPPILVLELQRYLEANPNDVALARYILEILARVGAQAPVEAWFQRPDIGDERTLLAGIPGAGRLEGARGVELLGEAARTGSTRRARRAAFTALLDRWDLARPIPGSHDLFREIFQRLSRLPDDLVAEAAAEALEDPAFHGGEASPEAQEGGQADEGSEQAGDAAEDRPATMVRRVDWNHLRALGRRPLLHLETERGLVTLELAAEQAPLTVDAITALAAAGRYDDTPFHRVIPNFVAQGGDVSRFGADAGAGFVLRSEFTRIPYLRGVLGMASAGKDTESSQFFVTHSPQPHLDGSYTAFGRVVRGRDVLEAIRPEDRVVRAWVTSGE